MAGRNFLHFRFGHRPSPSFILSYIEERFCTCDRTDELSYRSDELIYIIRTNYIMTSGRISIPSANEILYCPNDIIIRPHDIFIFLHEALTGVK